MSSEKKRLRKLAKGLVQDSLNGLASPHAAGIFPYTGQQGMSAATLGLRPVGNPGPTNGLPGVSASLQGGQSPLILEPEASGGLDLTKMEKAVKRQLKKAQKKTAKPLRKARRDPITALSRLELLSAELRPQHPARVHAAYVVSRAKLGMEATAATDGSLVKAAASIDPVEVVAALSEVEQALGISPSSIPWQPQQIDARAQLQRVMAGTSPVQSLAGTQDSRAMTAYTSPAAALGAVLKQDGLGERLAKAEAEVAAAEASGNSMRLSAAHQDLTALRLTTAHRMEGI